MAKSDEMSYLSALPPEGQLHARNKPFSDEDCAGLLASISAIMSFMPKRPARVLDLGCGTGWTSIFYAKAGYDVVGTDIAPDMISVANDLKEEDGLSNVEFVVSDFENHGLSGFDCAIFFDCLHHADDEKAAVAAAYNALKPGGILITHEPGRGHSKTPASLNAMQLYGVNERDMPPSLIIDAAREAGFRSWKVVPLPQVANGIFYAPITRGKKVRRVIRWFLSNSLHEGAITILTK